MLDPATGPRRKPPISTGPKDMPEYLRRKIAARAGAPAPVAVIHGDVAREVRRAAIAAFAPPAWVPIADDAVGKGVNPRRGAPPMIAHDPPWNPNRLGRRRGRIRRIGRTEVVTSGPVRGRHSVPTAPTRSHV